MTGQSMKAADQILGYTLKKRIGAGSYGEVWMADAPGGITKAVKFIYGWHDENRAKNELKSLNKIKQVRHPFLLSLERIEVVKGRLVVISELADMSLNDRFLACCDEGLPGIPRSELLGYLKDAADALDYISDAHSLQHLDIKPENLLIVGGHIKVADFGLVKEVRETTQSLMSGLTPAYAPPELFDGRPNRTSDQYSLAVVYAEMVCGKRPFGGTTAAQLAVQHMQGQPNLKQLPPRDQSIVFKALAKKADLRFPNCRDFVEELMSREGGPAAKKRRRLNPAPRASDDARTIPLKDTKNGGGTMVVSTDSLVGRRTSTIVQKMGPLPYDPAAADVRPTLFIGIGNTGTQVVRRIQAKMRKYLGDLKSLPAIGCLCIDTDRSSLIESADEMHVDSINYNEILAIPLRKAEDYRNDANMHLAWLSRRWIYNVPRSLQTEGLRPLGRLAFVDHSDAFFTRVNDLLSNLTTAEALATTAETTGLVPVQGPPRVFVVSSIAGGIGSGCVIDVAYALRVALAELGLADDDIHGILMHSTAKFDRDSQIAVANTYACLSELQHYTTYGYPGDETCGLPPFDAEDRAFRNTYFVNLGIDIREDEYEEAISGIAEFLFCNSVTRCSSFFDACRDEDQAEYPHVRTLGVCSTELGFRGAAAMATIDVSLMLLEEWLGSHEFDAVGYVDHISGQIGLTADGLVGKITQALRAKFGADLERQIGQDAARAVDEGAAADQGVNWRLASAELDRLLEPPTESASEHLPHSVAATVEQFVEKTGNEYGPAIVEAIAQLIDFPGARLGGARDTHNEMDNRVRSVAESLQQKMDANARQLASEAETMDQLAKRPKDREKLQAHLTVFSQLRWHGLVLSAAHRLLNVIEPAVSKSLNTIVHARRELDAIAEQLRIQRNVNGDASATSPQKSRKILPLDALMAKSVVDQLPSLLPRVKEQLERDFIAPAGGLRAILFDDTTHARKNLAIAITEASQESVTQVMSELNVDQIVRDSHMLPAALEEWLSRQLKSACPHALEHGGKAWLMLGLPEFTTSSSLQTFIRTKFGQEPTMIPCTKGDLVLAYEVGDVSLANIAIGLLEERPDCGEYVSRLHSRLDVDWSRLTDIT